MKNKNIGLKLDSIGASAYQHQVNEHENKEYANNQFWRDPDQYDIDALMEDFDVEG